MHRTHSSHKTVVATQRNKHCPMLGGFVTSRERGPREALPFSRNNSSTKPQGQPCTPSFAARTRARATAVGRPCLSLSLSLPTPLMYACKRGCCIGRPFSGYPFRELQTTRHAPLWPKLQYILHIDDKDNAAIRTNRAIFARGSRTLVRTPTKRLPRAVLALLSAREQKREISAFEAHAQGAARPPSPPRPPCLRPTSLAKLLAALLFRLLRFPPGGLESLGQTGARQVELQSARGEKDTWDPKSVKDEDREGNRGRSYRISARRIRLLTTASCSTTGGVPPTAPWLLGRNSSPEKGLHFCASLVVPIVRKTSP